MSNRFSTVPTLTLAILAALPAAGQTGLGTEGVWFADGTLQESAALGPSGEVIDQDCAVNTGCFPGDVAGFPVTVTEPGSYRLTGNLVVTSTVDAIAVQTDHVTLDLAGFSIDGSGAGEDGIDMANRTDIEIRNGTIHDFGGYGVHALGTGQERIRIIDVRSEGNGEYGIYLGGAGHHVAHSTASGNGKAGIRLSDGGTVVFSVARENGDRGIIAANATIAHNTAFGNGNDGIRGVSSTIVGNTANENVGSGIECWHGLAKQNTVISNNVGESSTEAGIRLQGNCHALQNNVQGNLLANIKTTSSGSVIEENLLWNSGSGGCGLCLKGSGNFYANNRARANTTDYDVDSGNTDGGGNVSY